MNTSVVTRNRVRVGIVSTHRRWTSESEAWARYHLSLGFDKIYLFADDGCMPRIPSGLSVSVTPCTLAYWQSQSQECHFAAYLHDICRDAGTAQWGSPERVMQRQLLNACTAFEQAAQDGIDWLLHIDDDEYFWCPGISAREHFEGLHRAGIVLSLYCNHEAVLLDEAAAASRKGRRTLFKKHLITLTQSQREALSSHILPGKEYFVGHSNGKSAARVRPGTIPDDVHLFNVDDPMLGCCRTALPGILHRPYKNAGHFCEKHLSLGVFPTDTALGKPLSLPPMYMQARQLCDAQDIGGLRSFYSQSVLLNEAELNILEAEGYLLDPEVLLPFDDDWHTAQESEAASLEVAAPAI